MDKQSKRINNETIKFVNKTYEALSILKTQREDIRYFNYDHNDELIDETVNRMYELLDDMYHKSIDKKSGWVVSKGNMKPKKLVFHDCKDTSPQTPEQKPRHRRKSTVPKRNNNVFLKKNLINGFPLRKLILLIVLMKLINYNSCKAIFDKFLFLHRTHTLQILLLQIPLQMNT